ncbi:MAG: COX15/CtaA family protein [Saprospiraceae bacterium]|nr:COX15/CtaA family protein [Saprospiraceae bacterium]MBK7913075.1 COX15/CtaA family protein [Saprospiraceae bacterium]
MPKNNKFILQWLWAGLVLVLIQIILGGITRLTGSGLSITRWDIITGIWYPLSEEQWTYYFDLYKQTPQYTKVNAWMDLERFKFIFFWEYFHRLWARLMGLVFILPLCYFLFKNLLSTQLKIKVLVIFILAILVASLGWIMVASGLVSYPWVNAYKLSFHLGVAVVLLSYIYSTILFVEGNQIKWKVFKTLFNLPVIFSALIFFQIYIGGIMAGMKAALVAPEWPLLLGQWFPKEIFQFSNYSNFLFSEYEISHTAPVIIQFFHRLIAYIIFVLMLLILYRYHLKFRSKLYPILFLVVVQILLGIFTLINSHGSVPLWLGSLHQLTGIVLLLVSINFLSIVSNAGSSVK